MAPLTGDAGETFGNVPNQWSNVGNHEYHGRGRGTSYVPQSLPGAPTKFRKQDRTNTIRQALCNTLISENFMKLQSLAATQFRLRHQWTAISTSHRSYQHPQRESNRESVEWELDTLTTQLPLCTVTVRLPLGVLIRPMRGGNCSPLVPG
ncbi:unnamed protein product [Protopolystoma xenopodis]|uniref:Uncharacterized protein n=1 Tax=Protopolystoma xenopodis TaxID=117903 RepID=A0A3S5BVY5_9PLAT|nr:unnamed protein product [Protopolystoma xenopodis]